MENYTAILLCFFELSFVAFLLMLLHSLRKTLGNTPFYLTLGTLFIFSQIIHAADITVESGISGMSANVGSGILFTPFMMSLLLVYAMDGTLAAQRLTLGAVAVSVIYFFLTLITAEQCNWIGFSMFPASTATVLNQLLNENSLHIGAFTIAIIVDMLVLPVIFQIFRNYRCNIFVSVLGAFIFTQAADTFTFTIISHAWSADMWDEMRALYFSRCITMVWLAILTTLYMKYSSYEDNHTYRSPMDYVKALIKSYTQGKILEEHARDWEGRFQVFIENSQDLIVLVLEDGTIADTNQVTMKTLGVKLDEIIESKFEDIIVKPGGDDVIPEAFRESFGKTILWQEAWNKLIKSRSKSIKVDWVLKSRDDEYHNLEFSLVLIEVGNSKMALLAGRDVSERVTLEFERTNLMTQLTHSQKLESIGRLAGGVAHDFNNLLHTIQGSLDSMPNLKNERVSALIGNINSAVDKASGLTGQLLGFAKKGKFKTEKADLAHIARVTYNLFEPMARKNIRFKLIIHPDLMIVKADASQLEQVFLNLLINAMDAMEGIEKAKLTLRVEPCEEFTPGWSKAPDGVEAGDYACVRIKDNGSGMSDEVKAKIFDPFFTTKDVGKGTGMGLAMAFGCIANHNGWIHVDSKEGKGTEFIIFLPVLGNETLVNIDIDTNF